MKKHGTMIGLLAVLVLLVGLYFLMGGISKKQAESELKKDSMVTNLSDLRKLEYTDGKTTMSMEKEKDAWYMENDKETKLRNVQMDSIEDTLVDIVALRELDKAKDLAEYGLDNPSHTITMKDKKGKEAVVYIGKAIGENYYAAEGDKKVVYIIEGVVVDTLEFDLEVLKETTE